ALPARNCLDSKFSELSIGFFSERYWTSSNARCKQRRNRNRQPDRPRPFSLMDKGFEGTRPGIGIVLESPSPYLPGDFSLQNPVLGFVDPGLLPKGSGPVFVAIDVFSQNRD